MARIRVRVRVTPMEPMTAKGAHRMVSATQAIIYPPEAATCSTQMVSFTPFSLRRCSCAAARPYLVRVRVRVRVRARVRVRVRVRRRRGAKGCAATAAEERLRVPRGAPGCA